MALLNLVSTTMTLALFQYLLTTETGGNSESVWQHYLDEWDRLNKKYTKKLKLKIPLDPKINAIEIVNIVFVYLVSLHKFQLHGLIMAYKVLFNDIFVVCNDIKARLLYHE